jgi:hypothetical protein
MARALDQDQLDGYPAAVTAAGAPFERWVTPGATDEQIDAALGPLDLSAPEELRVLWRWHNGWPRNLGLNPLGGSGERLMSVEEARTEAENARAVHAMNLRELETDSDPRYDLSWLPVFEPQLPLAVDCGVDRYEPTPLRAISWEDPAPPEILAESLGDLFDFWLVLLERGVWTWDAERGDWSVDRALLPEGVSRTHRLV